MKTRKIIFTIELSTGRKVKDLIDIFKETLHNTVDVYLSQIQANVIREKK